MKQISQKMGQLGNLSYGIYLCAFPIQQTIVYFFGGKMLPLLNIGLASVCSIVVGYVIYYWAEKECLKGCTKIRSYRDSLLTHLSLNSTAYQEKLAQGVASGILSYYKAIIV
ncbi:hypothetical protein ABG752_11060 [Streptococcus iniae]